MAQAWQLADSEYPGLTQKKQIKGSKAGNLFVSLEKKVRKLFCCLLKIDRFTLKKCTITP